MMTTKEGFAMKNLFMTMIIVLVFTLSLGHTADMTKYGGGSGGSSILTSYTVAALPGAPTAGQQVMVTDGDSTTDCTVGGGAEIHICLYNGTTWVSAGIAGAATVSNTAYNATDWNGEAGVAPSKDAVRDKFETLGTMSTATATDYVTKALYDAHSILYATSDDTPAALTVGASTIVGRKASGNISAMSTSDVKTLLGYPTTGEFQTPITNPVTGTGTNHHWAYWTGTAVIAGKAVTASKVVCSDGSGDPVACTNLTDAAIPTASSLHLDDVITLSGVAAESTHLATFTGETITDNKNIKEALQLLETAVEAKLAKAGGTMTGKLVATTPAAGAAGYASINLPHGAAPTTNLADGDCWTTDVGLYCRINSSTQGPFTSTGGTGYATVQEEGSNLTQRTAINFIGGGITAADDGGTKTNVTLSTMLSSIAALADPNADRILFWDDSESAYKFMTAGTGLNITAENITVDRTALGTGTWGTGSGIVWTFDASGGTDPILTLGDGVFNISTGTLQQGGVAAILGGLGTTDNAIVRSDYSTSSVQRSQGSLATIDDSGSINIPTGQSYKINNTALAVANITGAAPLASPTLTGMATVPDYSAGTAGLIIGSTALQTTATRLNYLAAATGTTGTTNQKIVFDTSPILVTPNLGTPSALTLTNATGLPIAGITGLGTGVGTALAVNIGSAGASVLFNGALGTPSGGTLTNATGLPIATGVSGLGSGVATFLATPSGANLATALSTALPATKGGTGLTSLGTNVATALGNNTNAASGLVQLTAAGALPALDGSALTGIPGTISGLTTNTITKATAATTIGNSLLVDNGTTLTYSGTGGISAPSYTASKSSGVAGASKLYEANSTDTDGLGWMGPASVASSWLYQLNSTAPSAGQVMAFAAPTGTGGPGR
jgi:hypothetical protein